jgi:tetratricopeptide (TPR) repeat protein
MRSLLLLLTALATSFAGTPCFAQSRQIDPHSLPAQIVEQQQVVATAHGSTSGEAWLRLAVLLQDAARFPESEHAYRQALPLLEPRGSAVFADVLDHMGTMYAQSGQPDKAEPLERRALTLRTTGGDTESIGVSHTHLAAVLLAKSDLRAAEAEADSAVNLLVPEVSPAAIHSAVPEEKMTALINRALARCAGNAFPAALADLQLALTIAHGNYSDDSLPVGYLDSLVGYASWKSGDLPAATASMQKGTHELSTAIGQTHPVYLRALAQYETMRTEAGRTAQASKPGTTVNSE